MYAFPNVHDPKTGSMAHGMTLRDYFAAHALQAMIAEPSIRATPDEFAQKAYQIAEAMIQARDL